MRSAIRAFVKGFKFSENQKIIRFNIGPDFILAKAYSVVKGIIGFEVSFFCKENVVILIFREDI